MKRAWFFFFAAVFAAALLTGCRTAAEVNASYEDYLKNRQATQTVSCGDQSIDAIAASSAKLHEKTNKLLDDYLAATNPDYRRFCGAVDYKMNEENLSRAAAVEAVKQEYMKTPEGKKEWEDVEKGIKAVEALDPARKLAEIKDLLASTASASVGAAQLGSAFRTLDGTTVRKAVAVMKVADQTGDSIKALNYLQRFYSMNQEIPRSEPVPASP
ncbi:MAG: hypothetical protein AB7F32_03160 [Victivallaceae bacterium]